VLFAAIPSWLYLEWRSNTPSNQAIATTKAATQLPVITHHRTMHFLENSKAARTRLRNGLRLA
jgi:hypothetical protein